MEIFGTKTLDLSTRPARHRGEVATCRTLAPVREAGVHPGLPGGGQRRGPGVSAQLQLEVFELRRVDFWHFLGHFNASFEVGFSTQLVGGVALCATSYDTFNDKNEEADEEDENKG